MIQRDTPLDTKPVSSAKTSLQMVQSTKAQKEAHDPDGEGDSAVYEWFDYSNGVRSSSQCGLLRPAPGPAAAPANCNRPIRGLLLPLQ